MFTGIIQKVGKVLNITQNDKTHSITFETNIVQTQNLREGDSIAVNGVCLTMKNIREHSFEADIALSTLEKTNLKILQVGQTVNLELALKLQDFIGGHLVQGHVQDTAIIKNISRINQNYLLEILMPESMMKYCISEGSITIDGVSLTISSIEDNIIKINIIPHTWENTIISTYYPNQSVNIEVDFIAKYVEKWLSPWLDRFNTKMEHKSLYDKHS